MKYVIAILLIIMLLYILSFAKYNWTKKNKLAAMGAAIIAFAAFGLSVFVIFFSGYEL